MANSLFQIKIRSFFISNLNVIMIYIRRFIYNFEITINGINQLINKKKTIKWIHLNLLRKYLLTFSKPTSNHWPNFSSFWRLLFSYIVKIFKISKFRGWGCSPCIDIRGGGSMWNSVDFNNKVSMPSAMALIDSSKISVLTYI